MPASYKDTILTKHNLSKLSLQGVRWYFSISLYLHGIPDMSWPDPWSKVGILLQYLYFFCSDNGVTIKISKYQFFTELGAFITFMIIGVYNDSLAFKDAERWVKLLGQSLLLDVDIIGFNWVLNFLAQALSFIKGIRRFRKYDRTMSYIH